MALAAMLSVGLCSCEKENEDNGSVSGGGGGETPGGGTSEEWVDLGLPSGRLWAICNLGATKPEEYGDYYAWGETDTKSTYNFSTYKHCRGDYNQLTKYCSNASYGYNGFTDTLTVLQAIDDAATARLGNGARIPTKKDWEELIANTTNDWTTENGVYGRKFSASNGKSLFLPAAGKCDGSALGGAGGYGYYWSSSLITDGPIDAWGCDFSSGGVYPWVNYHRYYGLSVRAVR